MNSLRDDAMMETWERRIHHGIHHFKPLDILPNQSLVASTEILWGGHNELWTASVKPQPLTDK